MSKRKHESEKLRVYDSENAVIAVAGSTTVVVDAGAGSLDAVGPGARALLLDVAHPIIVPPHSAVRWTPTSPQVAEAEGAIETAGPIGIVR